MKERQSVTKEVSKRYRKASKKEKGRILDEFIKLTGYNRKYGAALLRIYGYRVWLRGNVVVEVGAEKKRNGRKRRKRTRVYDDEVYKPLKAIWVIMNYICGRRLVAVLPEIVSKLEQEGEIELDGKVREKLHRISASTIDRLFVKDRKRLRLKSRSRTKPGTLLKHQIPIRTFSEWDEGRPGFMEIDLVGHDGGDVSGQYMQSLNCVDVCSGWTETFAVRNKAQVWVFEGIGAMREKIPFDLLGIDSDNGSEFINDQLLRYCKSEGITFTRSRAYRKNDSCHVEQKNYTSVRQYVGYARYDTPEELSVMNELYRQLSLYLNYFHPVMKLRSKERIGSRVRKKYDTPTTPYRRVLESSWVPEEDKERIREVYAHLRLGELKRSIDKLQRKLLRLTTTKKRKEGKKIITIQKAKTHNTPETQL